MRRETATYARITTCRVKADEPEKMNTKLEGMTSEIMSLSGIEHYSVAAQDDGNCMTVAIYDNEAAADANASEAKELFRRFA